MEKEVDFVENVEFNEVRVLNNKLKIDSSDLPIYITLEGRKEYILRFTESGGLILQKKD